MCGLTRAPMRPLPLRQRCMDCRVSPAMTTERRSLWSAKLTRRGRRGIPRGRPASARVAFGLASRGLRRSTATWTLRRSIPGRAELSLPLPAHDLDWKEPGFGETAPRIGRHFGRKIAVDQPYSAMRRLLAALDHGARADVEIQCLSDRLAQADNLEAGRLERLVRLRRR